MLPPPQLSASSPTNDSITVSWAPVANAVQYSLSLYKSGWNTTIKHNTSNTNWIVSGLDIGSVYVIKGFAWDPEGRQGEDSVYINQMTSKRAPRLFSVCVYGNTHDCSYKYIESMCLFYLIM